MFLQITVSGILVLFLISVAMVREEFTQKESDESLFDELEDINNEHTEPVSYLRRTFDSLDFTLAISAGLGTLITAILSYRFGQNRWSDLSQRLFCWIRRKELPVKVIKEPPSEVFPTQSKECLIEQFHEASSDTISPIPVTEETTEIDSTENSDSASISSCNEKSQSVDVTSNSDIDVIINATEQTAPKLESVEEPKYKTFEARLMAVEDSLMQDIDSRMKIFEQQLEEFRAKMRRSEEDSTALNFVISATANRSGNVDPLRPPTEEMNPSMQRIMSLVSQPHLKRPGTKHGAIIENMGDTYSEKGSRENLSISSAGRPQGDTISNISSDSCSVTSDQGSLKSSNIPRSQKPKIAPVKVKPEVKDDQAAIRQENPVKTVPLAMVSSAAKRTGDSNSPVPLIRRTQPRTSQQMRAILQHTTERLAQRKTVNKSRQPSRF